MKPGEIHHFKTKVEVPVPCQVQSRIDVLSVHPKEIRTAGQVEIVLDVAALPPGAKPRGDICLQTSRVVRLIKVSGQAAKDRPAASTAPIIVDGLPPPPQPPPSPLTSPLKSTPPTSTSLRTNVTVDKMGGGEYRTLQEAIQNATPGTRINVKPGLYKEALIINKSLEIVGDGPRSEIRIECNEGNCLRIETDYAKFRGLTLRAVGRGSKERFAVAITHGDIEMEECDISSDSLACVGIFGGSARPVLRYCKIHDGKSAGVIFYDRAQGQLESCEIIGNAQAGVEIFDGADPVLRKCTISKGKQVGVLVRDSGKGTFEGCDIFANALAGVEITQKAAPTLRDCKIHDGEYIGVRVCDQGKGLLRIARFSAIMAAACRSEPPAIRRCANVKSPAASTMACSSAARPGARSKAATSPKAVMPTCTSAARAIRCCAAARSTPARTPASTSATRAGRSWPIAPYRRTPVAASTSVPRACRPCSTARFSKTARQVFWCTTAPRATSKDAISK